MLSRLTPLLAGLTVLLACSLVHGVWTQRWQRSPVLEAACAQMQRLPVAAGEWTSTEVSGDAQAFQQARAARYWIRRYSKSGFTGGITVILMCGRPGHMAVHTPDICYPGAGFAMIGKPTKTTVQGSQDEFKAEFWTARFRHETRGTENDLRIYWGWSAGDGWQAPNSPRWTLGGEAYLYKLYVVCETSADGEREQDLVDFLREFVASAQPLSRSAIQ